MKASQFFISTLKEAPADAEIAAHIERVAAEASIADLPRAEFELAGESVIQAYVAATATVAPAPAGAAASGVCSSAR